jgi:hypothetical protein
MNPLIFVSNKTTVRLIGGLGNQLFIYFAGLYISKKWNTKLVCDLSYLDSDRTKHGVSITSFNIDGEFVRKFRWNVEIIKLVDRIFSRLGQYFPFVRRFYLILTRSYLSSGIGYDSELEKIGKDLILKGYFQTWKYVRALEGNSEIELKIKNPSAWFSNLMLEAEQTRPIVIHVRHGDYREDVNSFIGILGPSYYQNALSEIRSIGIDAPIWVFSDDIESAKRVINFCEKENVVWIVSPIGIDPAEELAIMQLGGAHIIANSTFSWWGAYLSKSTKMVIAPCSWFKSQVEPLDLIPPEWKRIENDWL